MQVFRGLELPAVYRRCFVAIGNFDGVHRGHQAMLRTLRAIAHRHSAPAVVMTFDPHPVAILKPEHTPPSLSTLDRKLELIRRLGIDAVVAYPTTRSFLQLSPEQFFQRVLVEAFQARGLVEGPNFRFGHGRAGDIPLLRRLCEQHGMQLHIEPPVEWNGQLVSSSAIRASLREGRIDDAVGMLGHLYRVSGCVARGAGRGRAVGFPTANLEGIATLIPAGGVYAGFAHVPVGDDTAVADEGDVPACVRRAAAIHVGPNPTFDDAQRKVEVHVLDFRGDLYGHSLDVDFLTRIRSTQKFPDAAALARRLQEDIDRVRAATAAFRPGPLD